MSNSGHFEPLHAAHAIEQVVFVLQFNTPVSDVVFTQIETCAKQFETDSDMPRLTRLQGISISFSESAAATAPSQRPDFMLRRMRADGSVEKELRIKSNSMVFMTSLYTRWDAALAQAKSYFEKLIPYYAEHSKIVGISLNYIDKFVWVGDGECKVDTLLRVGSKYLCPQIFDAKDFWHSHTGAFIRIDEQTKRLLNINVDYLEEARRSGNMQNVVSITSGLTDMLNQPGYKPADVGVNEINQLLERHAKELHLFGKKVLGNVINNEMSKRIALEG